ncbi:MAG: rhodanese-like domain-containing protein [Candidatus Sumerlaeia bacterium]
MWSVLENKSHYSYLSMVVCLMLFVLSLNSVVCADLTPTRKKILTGPFCGIYSVYGAMCYLGVKTPITELMQSKYVGSREGSSLLELKNAVEDHGLQALPFANLTLNGLRRNPNISILHVKKSPESIQYDHFILFLGVLNDQAIVLDAPDPVKFVPIQEISQLWDGKGLVVSTKPVNKYALFLPVWVQVLQFLGLVTFQFIVLFICVRYAARLPVKKMYRRSIICVSLFTIVPCLIGVIYHYGSESGLYHDSKLTDAFLNTHTLLFIPKVNFVEMNAFAKNGGTVFVDARFEGDYKRGHILNAINIPVDTDDNEIVKRLRSVNHSAKIIVYCQSSACPFGGVMVRRLIDLGFKDISLYRGGWLDWAGKIKS